jgi:hypothetical protein
VAEHVPEVAFHRRGFAVRARLLVELEHFADVGQEGAGDEMVEIDGEKEEHKEIKAKDDAAIKNLIHYILSR